MGGKQDDCNGSGAPRFVPSAAAEAAAAIPPVLLPGGSPGADAGPTLLIKPAELRPFPLSWTLDQDWSASLGEGAPSSAAAAGGGSRTFLTGGTGRVNSTSDVTTNAGGNATSIFGVPSVAVGAASTAAGCSSAPAAGNGIDGVKIGGVVCRNDDDDGDAESLLARLAGRAKQAAAAALSASAASDAKAPVLLPPPNLVESSSARETTARAARPTTVVPINSVGVSRAVRESGVGGVEGGNGGFDESTAAGGRGAGLLPAGVGEGPGAGVGARLADLCKEDKAKVARLMQASDEYSCCSIR